MKKWVLLLLSVSVLSWGSSAVRKPGENWKQKFLSRNRTFNHQIFAFQDTAYSQAKTLRQIDFVSVPDVGNTENLMTIFKYLRDTRFIQNVQSPKQHRRISWYYPDDGCFVRAELMAAVAEHRNWPKMKKLFAFGNLAVRTRNTQEGMVRWWYHVAPTLRTGQVVWVLDPSISYDRPLTVQQWKAAMSAEEVNGAEQFALCDTHTFDPDSKCSQPGVVDINGVVNWQKQFSVYEWVRVLELGFDPHSLL